VTVLLTMLALACFAANSILCRFALAGGHIDPASFTLVRLASGAMALSLLSMSREAGEPARRHSLGSGLLLFAYAAAFSFAYVRIFAGLGALVLFGAVQTTMFGVAIASGERVRPLVWLGLVCALAGLVVLALPGAHGADPAGVTCMAIAGVAWALYSLRGRRVRVDPVRATAASFRVSVPLALALLFAFALSADTRVSASGVLLASASGVIASGLGYSVWYAALRRLSVTRAAVLQLLVPVIAAGAGVLLLGESIVLRVALAGAAILVGVTLAGLGGQSPATTRSSSGEQR
jgi:drug/metabolite transporter (DMT)-like permease